MKYRLSIISLLVVAGNVAAETPATRANCSDETAVSHEDYKGKWQVDWTYRTSPGNYAQSSAVSRISAHPSSCGLREHFTGTKDEPYFYEWTVTSLNAPDKEGVWFDSAHRGFLHYHGIEGEQNWPVRLVWQHDNGRLQTRFQYSPMTEDGFTVERHLSTDGGQTWALTSSAKYSAYQ